MKKKPSPTPRSLSFSQIVTRAFIAAIILLLFSASAFLITKIYFQSQTHNSSAPSDAPLQQLAGSQNRSEGVEEPADDVNLTFYERLSERNTHSPESFSTPAGGSQPELLHAPAQEKKMESAPLDSKSSEQLTEGQIRPVPYSVQVGSFQNLEAAQRMLKELKQQGFSPFIAPVHLSEGGTWYRVRIGNSLARNDAEKIAEEIRKKGEFQPLVVTAK